MKKKSIIFLLALVCSCQQESQKDTFVESLPKSNALASGPTYTETKEQISAQRKKFATDYFQADENGKEKIRRAITVLWVNGISNDLYTCWAGTPWDFNGTSLLPKQGTIACGFFVTTLLQDMDMKLNRRKLSTCAASEMMHRLVPHQKMKKLNGLVYNEFCDSLKRLRKGVYIIGLDFHVGFIVQDDAQVWFIHSNYIRRQGVIKEPVESSMALQASKTRWLICLTDDKEFISRWLKAALE